MKTELNPRCRPFVSSLAAGCLMLAGPGASALDLVDPTLEATVFSPVPTMSVALPGSAAVNFPAFLYSMSRTEPPRANEFAAFDADGEELFRIIVDLDAANLHSGARSYAGRMFASEISLPDDVPDGIYEISHDGSVTMFADLGGGNSDSHSVAFGSGSFGDFMYVANPTAGFNTPHTAIIRVGSDGAIIDLLVTDPAGPFYLAFPPDDAAEAYGDYLYYTLLNSNLLMRVDAQGNADTFATFAADERPFGLTFWHTPLHGNALIASVNHPDGGSRRRLVAVLPDGSILTLGTGLRGFRITTDPDSGDLFIANEGGGILRVSGPDCEGAPEQGEFLFSRATHSVLESAGTVALDVVRVCGTVGEAVVPYLIDAQEFDNPAVQLVDYRHPPGEATQSDIGALSFADGETRKSIAVEIIDNALVDGERRFAITLQQPSAGALREPERTVVTIIDDDAGTDVSVQSLTLTRISGNVNFAGLTADFNELEHRFRVTATIRNHGPLPVSGLILHLDLPKLHLAGFGQQPGGKCSIPVLDPPDPEFVKVVCSGLDELAPGATLELPDLGLYVGYARTIPENLQVEYFAWLETSLASVPDFNLDNNLRSALISPRTHGAESDDESDDENDAANDAKKGGGSLSPLWLVLLALALLANARRRWGKPSSA